MKTPLEEYPLYDVPEFRTLAEVLLRGRQVFAERPALADVNTTPLPRLSHGELAVAVARFGAALRGMGLKPRDHVAVISENRVQWGVAYLAAICFDFVAVPIDRNLKENEILTILRASDSRAAVYSENFRDMFQGFHRSAHGLEFLVDMDLDGARDGMESMMAMIGGEADPSALPRGLETAFPRTDPEALAVIVFTSGSMGSAKGVMLSQLNLCANLRGMLQMVEILPTDRFLSVLPIHHTYECTCGFLCPLVVGASTHFARSLKSVADDMVAVQPTIVLGVPLLFEKMYRRIMQAIAEKKAVAMLMRPLMTVVTLLEGVGAAGLRRKLFAEVHAKFGSAIRLLIVGGAAPDPQVARGFRSLGFGFIQGYGLTETAPILALNRVRKFRDEAAGLPLPGVTLRIEHPDAEGRGEILAFGPNVMLGYYKNEAATAAVITDGWFSTGDVGFIDGHGFLHINGRKKNVIIARNGENVFPEEIEEHVNKIDCVLESMVYAEHSDSGDELIAVLIVPDANAVYDRFNEKGREVTAEAVEDMMKEEVARLNKNLPVYKQIRRVRIKDSEFEKTTTQKIKRYLVKPVEDA